MAQFEKGPRLVEGAPSYAVQFILRSGIVPGTGKIASMDVWRAKLRDTSATQIMTSGVGATTQTAVEIDSTNMPGLYELQLALTDIDTPGPLTLLVEATGVDDLYICCEVVSRSGAF